MCVADGIVPVSKSHPSFTSENYTLQVPFAFKYAIDALTVDPTGLTAATTPLITLMPATLLLGYGAARAGSALFNELRNAVFAKVTLHAKVRAKRCIHAAVIATSLLMTIGALQHC